MISVYFLLALSSVAATAARLQTLRMYPAMRLIGGIGGLVGVTLLLAPLSPGYKGGLFFCEKTLMLLSFPLCLLLTRGERVQRS
jgi:hypothetical protein